ncbi:unnamed protein product [Linum trigynum]|uniref:Disease resistance N-terminal domain-containing protein n=1 Tax=Linum trigynum TaxID=586398 RepID=A0AAV2CDR4_9ROSI
MAEIVSQVLIQLGSILVEDLTQHGKLVRDVEGHVNKLTSTFKAIGSLLLDAEERELTDKGVEDWLRKLKDVAYEVDDVLDEWRTEILKRQIAGDHHGEHLGSS